MKKILTFALLGVIQLQLFSNGQKTNVQLTIDPTLNYLSENLKEEVWVSYLKIAEMNWIQFELDIKLNGYPRADEFYQKRHFANLICDYLQSEGLSIENVKIEFSTAPHVVVYKPRGFQTYANFVEDDINNVQLFYVNNSTGGTCQTKAGNRIVFGPNSFKAKGDSILLQVWEYNTVNDFVMSGHTSTSGNDLIASAGMFRIDAYDQGNPVTLESHADAKIQFPDNNFKDQSVKNDFQAFYGNQKNNIIDWKPTNDKIIDKRELSEKELNKKLKNKYTRKITVTKTEIHYVQLCRNLPLIEPQYNDIEETTTEEDFEFLTATSSWSPQEFSCNYSKSDYTYITNKYGRLNIRKSKEMVEITSFEEFSKRLNDTPNKIFLALNGEQAKDLKKKKKEFMNDQKKKVDDLNAKIKEENKRIEEERKKREEEEKARLARLEDIRKNELKYFPIEMKIKKLGQINCDRFPNDVPKTNIIVKLDDFKFDQIRVYAVFNDIKSVIPARYNQGSTNGYVQFYNLPLDKDVLYVAATFKGEEVKLAYLNKNIQKEDIVNLNLISYSKARYRALMNDLIPN